MVVLSEKQIIVIVLSVQCNGLLDFLSIQAVDELLQGGGFESKIFRGFSMKIIKFPEFPGGYKKK